MNAFESPDAIRRLLDDAALDASIRAALREIVLRHRLHGVPLAVWRDGRVVEVPAEHFSTLD